MGKVWDQVDSDCKAKFSLPEQIETENAQYHDMLMPYVEDNYHTVGLKLLSSFYWINQLGISELKWITKSK